MYIYIMLICLKINYHQPMKDLSKIVSWLVYLVCDVEDAFQEGKIRVRRIIK